MVVDRKYFWEVDVLGCAMIKSKVIIILIMINMHADVRLYGYLSAFFAYNKGKSNLFACN